MVDRQTASPFRSNCINRQSLCESAPPDLPVDTSDNARSLAILFSLGKFQFFDAGDLTWNVEKKLVCPLDLVGPVDLYQVTHHGMDISNHPTLVQTVAPMVAIMNNGPRKGGCAATVKLLKSIPSIQAAYQLHKNAATAAERKHRPGADREQGRSRRRVDPGSGHARRLEVHRPGGRERREEDIRVAVS